MPIAKSSETQVVNTTVQSIPSMSGFNDVTYNGIPIDVYGYFDINIANTERGLPEKLLSILEWTKDKDTIGDKLQKLRSLETQLGVPRGGESRIDRLHRWIILYNKIDDLKQRQDALSNRRY